MFLAIKVIGINTRFIFLELAVEAKILITETDFGSLVYLLNLFLGNCGTGENTSCMQISWLCSITHHPGAVTSAEGAISKLRPVSKAEHPAKNTLASQLRTTITHSHCSHFLIRGQRRRVLRIGQSNPRSELTVQLNAAIIFQALIPKIPIEIYIQAIHRNQATYIQAMPKELHTQKYSQKSAS